MQYKRTLYTNYSDYKHRKLEFISIVIFVEVSVKSAPVFWWLSLPPAYPRTRAFAKFHCQSYTLIRIGFIDKYESASKKQNGIYLWVSVRGGKTSLRLLLTTVILTEKPFKFSNDFYIGALRTRFIHASFMPISLCRFAID